MVLTASLIGRVVRAPGSAGPRPARVEEDFAGITWRVRPRGHALQGVLSAIVELSTELLVALCLLGFAWGWGSASPARFAVPAWALVQGAVIAFTMAWDLGRIRPAQVRITDHLIQVGSRAVPLGDLLEIGVRGSGIGPLHRAEVVLVHRGAEGPESTLIIAADGDDQRCLAALTARIDRMARAHRSTPEAVRA